MICKLYYNGHTCTNVHAHTCTCTHMHVRTSAHTYSTHLKVVLIVVSVRLPLLFLHGRLHFLAEDDDLLKEEHVPLSPPREEVGPTGRLPHLEGILEPERGERGRGRHGW